MKFINSMSAEKIMCLTFPQMTTSCVVPANIFLSSMNTYPDSKDLWPLLLTWINFNPSMDKNHKLSKVWDEIIYPFLNINICIVEGWISDFIPYFIMDVITYPCWD